MLEEFFPRRASVFLQLALEVGDAEDAEIIPRVDAAHEVVERSFAKPILDHADDFAPLVVTHAEEVDDVTELRDLLDAGTCFAAADGAVQAIVAIVFAVDVGHPF